MYLQVSLGVDVLCSSRYPRVYWWCSMYLQVSLGVLLMFYVLTGTRGCTGGIDVLCASRYPWVYC